MFSRDMLLAVCLRFFSAVCYLSEGMGGPTLVTDQNIRDPALACRGWLVSPKLNRFVVFNGQMLHGVIPGASFNPQVALRSICSAAPAGVLFFAFGDFLGSTRRGGHPKTPGAPLKQSM
jgi:hypothetical protein